MSDPAATSAYRPPLADLGSEPARPRRGTLWIAAIAPAVLSVGGIFAIAIVTLLATGALAEGGSIEPAREILRDWVVVFRIAMFAPPTCVAFWLARRQPRGWLVIGALTCSGFVGLVLVGFAIKGDAFGVAPRSFLVLALNFAAARLGAWWR